MNTHTEKTDKVDADAATNLLEAGATMKEVAQILGHKSVKTTEKYLHVNVDNLRRVVERLKSVA